ALFKFGCLPRMKKPVGQLYSVICEDPGLQTNSPCPGRELRPAGRRRKSGAGCALITWVPLEVAKVNRQRIATNDHSSSPPKSCCLHS
uniref:Uncharacterized protein n=1 Tax=Chelonoidis abingdonii TaxID=106734 RepID=A0A8C0J3C7_CHEAB